MEDIASYDDFDFSVINMGKGKGGNNSKKNGNPNGHLTSKHVRERERKIENSKK